MTNTSLLSIKFESLAETLRIVNNAVIALKKRIYKIPGFESISDDEISEYAAALAVFLRKILEVVGDKESQIDENNIVIQIAAENLRKSRRGDLDDLLVEIEHAISVLESNWKELNDEEIRLLDSVCWIIDSEASLTFRRIWKR